VRRSSVRIVRRDRPPSWHVGTGSTADRVCLREPGVDKIAVQAHPAEPCDAMAVPRGVVLTFDRPIDPSKLNLNLSHL